MSSCLSGGGRTYGFEFELIKSPSSSNPTTIQSTTSSSSTLSESSNSPLSISTTRKPRTPRKRPNQIYNEAAALLSTAYPYIFSRKHLTQNPGKFTKPRDSIYNESSESLLPYRLIDGFGIPIHHFESIQDKPRFQFDQKLSTETYSNSNFNSSNLPNDDYNFDEKHDFDAEPSMLDEEIEEGIIDSIMGNLSVDNDYHSESSNSSSCHQDISIGSSFGYPMPIGLGFSGNFELGFGFNWGSRKALKPVDDGDWWRFPAVDVGQISPRLNSNCNVKVLNSAVKKKMKKIDKTTEENYSNSEMSEEKGIVEKTSSGLILKLNLDDVLNAWSDRGSPFSEEFLGSELAGADLHARLADIDLCLDNGGGVREASVLRYKEKRRTRLFSKKIRYQVRKVNADTRPRMKGRFVRRPNSDAASE